MMHIKKQIAPQFLMHIKRHQGMPRGARGALAFS
jgi:hypothetical protein